LNGERVVVTGGAGFIGSNLAEELAEGNEVIILDDFSTGKAENISNLSEMPNVKIIEGSVTDLPLLCQLFTDIDYVFHLAADASVQGSVENPLRTNGVNITGTLNVLLAARDRRVRKVVFASSSAIYGDVPIPNVETMPCNPVSPYAVSKLVGEHYAKVFDNVYGLPTVSLRYFNVYGSKQDAQSEYAAVIPKFITRILAKAPPIIYGDGEQTRDFVFVSDAVKATITAAEEDVRGEVINIACGESISINGLAEKLIAVLGRNLTPIYAEPQPGDVKHTVADISKLKGLLNFEPESGLDEGLARTISYFEGRYIPCA
jgi:UDP-glucose 4-epimerase